ncbi:hypothetical protein BKA57DRAFT_279302 [Linnemannia elongata]|nr:hypothetical protein BKA57DRAFT_279302 [Linnemannia elongata]
MGCSTLLSLCKKTDFSAFSFITPVKWCFSFLLPLLNHRILHFSSSFAPLFHIISAAIVLCQRLLQQTYSYFAITILTQKWSSSVNNGSNERSATSNQPLHQTRRHSYARPSFTTHLPSQHLTSQTDLAKLNGGSSITPSRLNQSEERIYNYTERCKNKHKHMMGELALVVNDFTRSRGFYHSLTGTAFFSADTSIWS